jgi:cell wall-associated NlpC family hydrolase
MKRDPRLTPAHADLAAEYLRGEIESARYVPGRTMHVRVGLADLHGKPSSSAAIVTQALFGEDVMLYEERESWAWVQLANDDYVGYLRRDALADGAAQATHRVCVGRSIVYPAADIKAPAITALPLDSHVKLKGEEGAFGRLADGGFMFMHHLKRLSENVKDFVAVAEGFLGSPYLWGGKSSLGIDCSGLVQIALAAAGVTAPRDTDLQESALGTALPIGLEGLRRGDLVFWKGHVGIMRDAQSLLHANAHHMLVTSECLAGVRDHIRLSGGGEITAIKRL